MPTGYTAPIIDHGLGFKEFALGCARAFGALIEMRDDPMNAPIPDEIKPSSWAADRLAGLKTELVSLETMSEPERIAFGQARKEASLTSIRLGLEKDEQENAKFLAVRRDVEAWEPPTPDHVEMKNFMLQQLNTSLHDLGFWRESLAGYESKNPAEFYADALTGLQRNVESYTEQVAEENKRASDRTGWIQALKKSLNDFQPK